VGEVLVAGAINTDLVARVTRAPEAGETVTGQAFNVFGGGKGANQALSCARSGASTAMLGALGDDDFGRQRVQDLRSDCIDVASVMISRDAPSGVALIVVDAAGQNRISYVPGATATIPADWAVAAFRRIRPDIVLSTNELPQEALVALFDLARNEGTRVIMNATPEPSIGRQLLPLVDILILNETEAAELLDGRFSSDGVVATHELRRLGPNGVVLTLGADGAVCNIDDEVIRVAAPEVSVIDTTGAGDALCGAFAAQLARDTDVNNAVRAGIAAGSLAVTMDGAQRSMPHREDVQRMMQSIVVEEA
jgi:ribokinase